MKVAKQQNFIRESSKISLEKAAKFYERKQQNFFRKTLCSKDSL